MPRVAVPPPASFRTAAFWRGRTPDQLRAAVRRGKPGTMMAPFESVLSEAEIAAVVVFLARFDPAAGSTSGVAPAAR